MAGGGIEYGLDRGMSFNAKLRAGPSVPLTGYQAFPTSRMAWCSDGFNLYRCGPIYSTVPAVEMLVGLSFGV
jgi:hypothetical protein